MAKNGHFWPIYLIFSYSTVTTSILMLQNVSYHHTEQQLQTWTAHRCLMGLILAKNGPKIAKNRRFWPFYLVLSYSTITSNLLMLQNVSYHHTEQLLQTWIAYRCILGLKIAKNGPKMAKNVCFWLFCLDSSSSTVATTLQVLQNVRYYHLPISTTKLSYRTDYINIQKSMMTKKNTKILPLLLLLMNSIEIRSVFLE